MAHRRSGKMERELVPIAGRQGALPGERSGPPAIITAAGKAAAFAYAEFFGAEIEGPHTYRAYRSRAKCFLRILTILNFSLSIPLSLFLQQPTRFPGGRGKEGF